MTQTRKLSKPAPLAAIVAACALSVFSTPAFADAGKGATGSQKAQSIMVQKTKDPQIITVTGMGEVMLMPDSLRTSISIRSRAETLAQARNETATKTQAVLDALKALNLQALQVRTTDISTTPIAEQTKEANNQTPPRIIGYEAESTLLVTLKGVAPDVLQVEGQRVLNTALNAGANVVSGFNFFMSKPRDAYRQALAVAVADAEMNAKTIAKTAGIRMVGLQTISTESGFVYDFAQKSAHALHEAATADEEEIPLEVGEIRVTAQVTARYLFRK